MKICFELSQPVLEKYRELLVQAREKAESRSIEEKIHNAQQLILRVNESDTSDYIRTRVNELKTLIDMVIDQDWGTTEGDVDKVIEALAYFTEPQDLIPDDVPGLGFLDDAIMMELVISDLKHEIQAYRDYLGFKGF